MTRRERKEARLEKRAAWARSRDAQSAAGFKKAETIASGIPLGQPILVGHHSEAHHRRDLERIDSGMRQGVESQKMAAHHRSVADGIAAQLETSIFSDDHNALEALRARIAEREAERERCASINKVIRKVKPGQEPAAVAAALKAAGLELTPDETATLASVARNQSYYCDKKNGLPVFPPYHLSNLGGRISADRKRLEVIEYQQRQRDQAEASPGGLLVRYIAGEDFEVYPCPDCGGLEVPAERRRFGHECPRCGGSGRQGQHNPNERKYVLLTWAEKPPREVREALKGAGFYFHSGTWQGETAKLPEGILPTTGEEAPTC